jgi:hypothetical protein
MRRAIALAVVLVLVFAFWRWRLHPPPEAATSPTTAPSLAPAALPPPAADSPLAARLHAPDGTAADDLVVLHEIIGQFITSVKEPYRRPIGLNEDLAAALRGENPQRLVFIPAGHPAFNAAGQIIDRWGTPLFVHPRAADALDLRSAGPDRRLFTDDDVVIPRRKTDPGGQQDAAKSDNQ